MKVLLITTLPRLEENQRIEEEVKAFGHEFALVSLEDFSFEILNGELVIPGLTDLQADVVIVRGIFESIKAISFLVQKIRKKGIKVFDNNLNLHNYSIDKITDIVKLATEGIPIPETIYAKDFNDIAIKASKLEFPVVIKSSRMGKGASVFKLNAQTYLEGFLKELEKEQKQAKSYLVQEFIPYEYDLRCLVIGSQIFTMRRIPGEGEFRANFSLGGSVEPFKLDKEGLDLALNALKAVDLQIGGVDILIDKENNKYILEVNHTAGFIGMEKALGQNIGKVWVQFALENAQ